MADDKHPVNFFKHESAVDKALAGKEILLFLDYDGTLTPIVDTPDLAVISGAMRQMVRKVSEHMTVSIVSGRATDDVKSKVNLEGIFYAGSHGFEIIDPKGKVTVNEEAKAIRKTIDEVHARLSEQLKGVPGALVEHVKYTISTHYRLVAQEDFSKIEAAVDGILAEYKNLRKTSGKKVFEIRPAIDWDKGKAVNWILDVLKFKSQKHVPIYIGDDTTDEDAFRALIGKGLGLLVAEEPRPSAARYMIKNTDEVYQVLESFLSISKT